MLENHGKPAQLIAALWVLGRDEETEHIPNYRGILDKALQSMIGTLPIDVEEELHFSVTSVGLRCLELPQIVNDMQYLMLADISTSTSLVVTVEEQQAYRMLYQQRLKRLDAFHLARKFYKTVKEESGE